MKDIRNKSKNEEVINKKKERGSNNHESRKKN